MNANRQRFWMIAEDAQWERNEDPPTLRWDASRRVLRLAGLRALAEADPKVDVVDAAATALKLPRHAIDPFGSRAFWDDGSGLVRSATPGLPGDVVIAKPSTGPTDLAMGYDGILYLAVDGKVALHDPRQRWETPPVGNGKIDAWRLAPRHEGGAWVLDRTNKRLGMVRGMPLPHRPPVEYTPETWRPLSEEPDPPRLAELFDIELPGEELVAIASGPGGVVSLLTWNADGEARLRLVNDGRTGLERPLALLYAPERGLLGAYSLAWLSEDRIAVLAAGRTEAPVYELPQDRTKIKALLPAGDLYPLRDHDGRAFFNGPGLPPVYPLTKDAAPGEVAPGAALHRLSFPSYAKLGAAVGVFPLDSGAAATEWHRLYLEACIPPRCAIRVFLAASDEAFPPGDGNDWHEHRFGVVSDLPEIDVKPGIPRGAWVSIPSELPFHQGLLPCPPERNRAGLFTCLVQRAGRRVTALMGRYLWVRIELRGDGRATPELAALRAWSSRFSYVDHYLPELYREDLLGPEGDDPGAATPADFLERFLGNLEGVMTPLEDRIASSYLLTDARTVPDDALEWLGSWIGLAFEPGFPPERRRRLLQAAPALYRRRGTLTGLRHALDIATGGGVAGGEVVVLEEFRLRRTFATILGVDMADEDDPLLAGLTISGNSYVGDTLFLGDESHKEFLALFAGDLPLSKSEERAVDLFFERLAHRVSVLVHQDVEPQDLGLIRRVAEAEAPAHVRVRVITARRPLVVGLSALIGVETYLGSEPVPQPATVQKSFVGQGGGLLGPATLDPRLGGGDPFAPPDDFS
jgi:phage tail-like protein